MECALFFNEINFTKEIHKLINYAQNSKFNLASQFG